MSRQGGGSKQVRVGSHPKGRVPTYKNKVKDVRWLPTATTHTLLQTAFAHNPHSKKSQAIMATPVTGLCRRCTEKIEWRKQYRKYKPLKAPASCRECRERTVVNAYHNLCKGCSERMGVCAMCCLKEEVVRRAEDPAELKRLVDAKMATFHLRQQKSVQRRVERGELTLADVLELPDGHKGGADSDGSVDGDEDEDEEVGEEEDGEDDQDDDEGDGDAE